MSTDKTYRAYLRAFRLDLGQSAVWPPGSNVQLGDYGEVLGGRWQHLGNICDISKSISQNLNKIRSAFLKSQSLGSAEIVSAESKLRADVEPVLASAAIRFGSNHSVFLRCEGYRTDAYEQINSIAKKLSSSGAWNKNWSFVSEVRTAERFVILVADGSSGTVKIEAKSSELLQDFQAGRLATGAGINISGENVLQFFGKNGPISMSLLKLRWIGSGIRRTEYAEGARSTPERVYVDEVELPFE